MNCQNNSTTLSEDNNRRYMERNDNHELNSMNTIFVLRSENKELKVIDSATLQVFDEIIERKCKLKKEMDERTGLNIPVKQKLLDRISYQD